MNEEIFQALFDIMEEHFAALKIPDSPETEQAKLTRAFSFSELPSTRRILIEQTYKGNNSPSLIRQYSCEHIMDQNTNTSLIKFSKIERTRDNEHVETWRRTVPYRNCDLTIPNYRTSKENAISTPTPKPANDQVEHMEVDEESNSTEQPTFAVPTNYVPAKVIRLSSLTFLKNSESITKIPPKSNKDFVKPVLNIRKLMKTDKKPSCEKKKLIVCQLSCHNILRTIVSWFGTCCKVSLFILFSMLIFNILYQEQNRKHSNDFVNTLVELKKLIYSQEQAMQTLIEYLQLNEPSLKVIALVGGTGVGKSYTAEIIKKNFPRSYSVRQYFPPIGNVKDFGFFIWYPNLIILENLKEHDVKDVVDFLKTYQDKYDKLYITVLAIFNIEQMDKNMTRSINMDRSLDTINTSFVDGNINVKIIPYNSLSEDALEKCIMNAAKDSNLTLRNEQVNLIKQYLLENNIGCKGAYSKVQVIGRQ